MTGGGFGGSAIARVEEAVVPDVARSATDAFVGHGWAVPVFLRAVPAEPGGRIA
jgi:galactokinase